MAKDMHNTKWDGATLTKIKVFEEYFKEWLNVALEQARKYEKEKEIEIYDLFCGSGFDISRNAGTPIKILDTLIIFYKKYSDIKINLFYNDLSKDKIEELKNYIENETKYKGMLDSNVAITYTSQDVKQYNIKSKTYFKLIFLDQYGVKFLIKIDEFMKRGVDIIIFLASSFIKRFHELDEFKQYLPTGIELEYENDTYKTHKTTAIALRQYYENKYKISHFSLVKEDKKNTNGLLFVTTNKTGQRKFLEAAWKIDPINGESNKFDREDIEKDKTGLFYNPDTLPLKFQRYKDSLIDFLQTDKTNIEIYDFGLDEGFLPKHTKSILEDLDNANKLNIESIENIKIKKKSYYIDKKEEKIKIRLKNETN